jgi:hypothetical protein
MPSCLVIFHLIFISRHGAISDARRIRERWRDEAQGHDCENRLDQIDCTKIDAIQASRVAMRGRMIRAMCYHAVTESRNRIT